MSKYLVCVSDTRHENYDIEKEILASIDAELVLCDCATEDDIICQCANADAILLDMAPMGTKVINALKKCKIVSRYGVGYDNLDVATCTEKGIQATNVPDYCAEDVAEHALALMMACLRDVARRDRLVRQGQWNIHRTSFRLSGKVLGVLGFGRIARELVKKCSGLGLSKVLVYDPYVSEEACSELGAVKAELEDVLKSADFLSLHMPVTPETTGMINKRTLGMMKPTAILVNTGRGPLINDEDMVEALKSHKILCAGLDTHNSEPLPAASPYFSLENVILTDHTAYSTEEATADLKTKAAKNVVYALTGVPPVYPINKI